MHILPVHIAKRMTFRSADFLDGHVGDRGADAGYRKHLCDRREEVRLAFTELGFDAWPLRYEGFVEADIESEVLLGGIEDGFLDRALSRWR